MFSEDRQKQQNYKRDHVDVLAVSSTSTDQRQQTPDRHMWSADVAALSVDGWQPNEDAVVIRSQRHDKCQDYDMHTKITITTFISISVFQVNLEQPVHHWFSSSTCSGREFRSITFTQDRPSWIRTQ